MEVIGFRILGGVPAFLNPGARGLLTEVQVLYHKKQELKDLKENLEKLGN